MPGVNDEPKMLAPLWEGSVKPRSAEHQLGESAKPRNPLADQVMDLCAAHKVTPSQVERAVTEVAGIAPKGTTIPQWPDGILNRVIAGWANVLDVIKKMQVG